MELVTTKFKSGGLHEKVGRAARESREGYMRKSGGLHDNNDIITNYVLFEHPLIFCYSSGLTFNGRK